MNDEKPDTTQPDGRPFDGGVGPTAQAAMGVPLGRPQLSAEQLRGDNDSPSCKAPAEKRGLSTAAIIVLVAVVALIALKVADVI